MRVKTAIIGAICSILIAGPAHAWPDGGEPCDVTNELTVECYWEGTPTLFNVGPIDEPVPLPVDDGTGSGGATDSREVGQRVCVTFGPTCVVGVEGTGTNGAFVVSYSHAWTGVRSTGVLGNLRFWFCSNEPTAGCANDLVLRVGFVPDQSNGGQDPPDVHGSILVCPIVNGAHVPSGCIPLSF